MQFILLEFTIYLTRRNLLHIRSFSILGFRNPQPHIANLHHIIFVHDYKDGNYKPKYANQKISFKIFIIILCRWTLM